MLFSFLHDSSLYCNYAASIGPLEKLFSGITKRYWNIASTSYIIFELKEEGLRHVMNVMPASHEMSAVSKRKSRNERSFETQVTKWAQFLNTLILILSYHRIKQCKHKKVMDIFIQTCLRSVVIPNRYSFFVASQVLISKGLLIPLSPQKMIFTGYRGRST